MTVSASQWAFLIPALALLLIISAIKLWLH